MNEKMESNNRGSGLWLTSAALAGMTVTGALMAAWYHFRGHKRRQGLSKTKIDLNPQKLQGVEELTVKDRTYVELCESLRKQCQTPERMPEQSQFLVAALITYIDKESLQEDYVYGVNAEPCTISGSICAERSCIVQLKMRRVQEIQSVYITTSTEKEVTPGPLCREWLSEVCSPDTRIVLFTRRSCRAVKIQELYPFRHLYSGLTAMESKSTAETIGRSIDMNKNTVKRALAKQGHNSVLDKIKGSSEKIIETYGEAVQVARMNVNSSRNIGVYHPLVYSCAILFSNGEVLTSVQSTCVEYGCTVDPFCKVIKQLEIEKGRNNKPIAIVRVDQYGVCHALPAKDRSYLTEYDMGDIVCFMHFSSSRLTSHSTRVFSETSVPSVELYAQTVKSLLPEQCQIDFANQ